MVGFKLDERRQAWLTAQLSKRAIRKWHIAERIADASFRCYYRIVHSRGTCILMHFAPDKENGERIIQTAQFFLAQGIRVPLLHSYDTSLGLALQEDMGSELLAQRNRQFINPILYYKAIDELKKIQLLDAVSLGVFDENRQMDEMRLFSEWFLGNWLHYEFPSEQLENYYLLVARSLAAAPRLCAHGDFHSRNIVLLKGDAIGLLDYQDACMGHFCYDMVSLLRDAYIRLPNQLVKKLLDYWADGMKTDEPTLHYQFALMTLQRCIKVCGIFSRLFLRDAKSRYLEDIPLVMSYLSDALAQLQQDGMKAFSSLELLEGHEFFHRLVEKAAAAVQEKLAAGTFNRNGR